MDGKEEKHCEVIKSFVDRNLHRRCAEIRDACFRQPHFHVGSPTTYPVTTSTDVDSSKWESGVEQIRSDEQEKFPMVSLAVCPPNRSLIAFR